MSAAVVILAAGSGSRVGADVNKVLLDLDGLPVLTHSVLHRARPGRRRPRRPGLPARRGGRRRRGGRPPPRRPRRPAGAGRGDPARLGAGSPRRARGPDRVRRGRRRGRPRRRPRAGPGRAVRAGGHAWRGRRAAPYRRSSSPACCPAILPAGSRPATWSACRRRRRSAPRPLLEAYRAARRDGFDGTDTAACLERYQPDVAIVPVPTGPANLKITYAEDLVTASRLR